MHVKQRGKQLTLFCHWLREKKKHFIRVNTVAKRKIHELDGESQTCKFMTLFFMSKDYRMIEQLKGKTEEIHIQKMSSGMSWNEKSSQDTRA